MTAAASRCGLDKNNISIYSGYLNEGGDGGTADRHGNVDAGMIFLRRTFALRTVEKGQISHFSASRAETEPRHVKRDVTDNLLGSRSAFPATIVRIDSLVSLMNFFHHELIEIIDPHFSGRRFHRVPPFQISA
ncbi:MAG: hypothetical protein AAB655_01245 [Patescibacteria group bacterium]